MRILAITALAFATTATAATDGVVFLTCDMAGDSIWKMALNENERTVTYEHTNGVYETRATFLSDKVTWSSAISTWTISRLDLTLTHSWGDHVEVYPCKLDDPPSRKF